MIILVGESGTGKSTVEAKLCSDYEYKRVISYTTRQPREGEVNGVHYHFISQDEFSEMLGKGLLAEHTEYNGNFYGASKESLMDNNSVIIVEKHGLEQILETMRSEVTSFYLTASETERLYRMHFNRGDTFDFASSRIGNDKQAFKGVDKLADYTIDTTNKSTDEVIDFILAVMHHDYFMTVTGAKVFPRHIEQSDFRIIDICHALGRISRFNGHSNEPITVLEHSIMVGTELYKRTGDAKLALLGLLHDASEAYMADIPRPFKKLLPDYLKLEAKVQDAIYLKFVGDMPTPTQQEHITAVDNWSLLYEAVTYTTYNDWAMKYYRPNQITPIAKGTDLESAFLSLASFLMVMGSPTKGE